LGYSYGFFAQDDWKVAPSLTLNFGLRYELHPPLYDRGYNSSNFLPYYQATIGGQSVHGALLVPNQQALSLTEPGLGASIAPTPILTASQAGIPSGLRYTYKKDFAPRIGFAWRPFHNDKTVIRGGYGRFFMTPLGFNVLAGWANTSTFIPFFGFNGHDPQRDRGRTET
jgi:outer membrane receptor protein involved in Fe transport